MGAALLVAPVASADDSSAPKRPNILFAIADDASFPHMSAYGCKWVQTPAFDRVARNSFYTSVHPQRKMCAIAFIDFNGPQLMATRGRCKSLV